MNTIAVIPMKLNNERLPNKNTKSFVNGNPLCKYILETLLKVGGVDDVYVYCSNPVIQEYLPESVNFIRRSESLDTSSTSMNEVLRTFSERISAYI